MEITKETEHLNCFVNQSHPIEPACNAGDQSSIPGSGSSPGEGNGNTFHYSCLENPMDRGAWWAMVHRVTQSRTRLKQLSSSSSYRLRWLRIHWQCRRPEFNPWVRKLPWRREWLHTPVFLPGELHGQRSLTGYSPWGHKESNTT